MSYLRPRSANSPIPSTSSTGRDSKESNAAQGTTAPHDAATNPSRLALSQQLLHTVMWSGRKPFPERGIQLRERAAEHRINFVDTARCLLQRAHNDIKVPSVAERSIASIN